MKISSDPGMVSALETWHHNTGTTETQQALSSAAADAVLPPSNGFMNSARDGAEGLLELDIWKGQPESSRQLVTAAALPHRGAEPASVIQAWADHIFQPLA